MNVVLFTKTQRYIESHWYWELDKQKTRERTNSNEVGDCIVVVAPVYGSWMTDENQRQVRENETTNGWHKKTITAHNIEPIHFQLNLARVGTHTLQSKRDRAAPFSRSTSTDFFCNEQFFFCVLFLFYDRAIFMTRYFISPLFLSILFFHGFFLLFCSSANLSARWLSRRNICHGPFWIFSPFGYRILVSSSVWDISCVCCRELCRGSASLRWTKVVLSRRRWISPTPVFCLLAHVSLCLVLFHSTHISL